MPPPTGAVAVPPAATTVEEGVKMMAEPLGICVRLVELMLAVITPVELTETDETYLDGEEDSHPQVVGSVEETADCTASVTVVRHADAAKITSETFALTV